MSTPDAVPAPKAVDAPDAVAVWVNGHPDDGMLHAGLDDQLSAAESALVAEHVSRCANCRSRVAEAHGMIAASRRIVTRAKETNEGAAQPTSEPVASSTARTSSAASAVEPIASRIKVPTAAADTPTVAAAPTVAAPAPSAPSIPASAPAPTPAAKPQTAKPVSAAPIAPSRPMAPTQRKASTFPWGRVGTAAALLAVVASGVMIWRTVGRDFGSGTPAAAPAPIAARPVAQPDTIGVADEATREPAAAPATSAVEAPVQVASANGKLAAPVGPTVAAFDSLVLTRRTCASACDEFTLFVMSNGSVHYVVHARNGQDRSANATTADAALRRLSALITTVLFETSAVPSSGRSVCTVFDASHVPALQLMVAHGSSSALHANSCSASPKVLLTLGAQIDSLAGSERLQKTALQPETK